MTNLNLDDHDLLFMLEIVDQHHAVQWMKRDEKMAKKTELLIQKIHGELKKNDKLNIFDKVFKHEK